MEARTLIFVSLCFALVVCVVWLWKKLGEIGERRLANTRGNCPGAPWHTTRKG